MPFNGELMANSSDILRICSNWWSTLNYWLGSSCFAWKRCSIGAIDVRFAIFNVRLLPDGRSAPRSLFEVSNVESAVVSCFFDDTVTSVYLFSTRCFLILTKVY